MIREDCRLCGHAHLTSVLSLPSTPLANEFPGRALAPLEQERFPLYLASCDSCGHVQLPVVVDPMRLFRDYVYVSGTSPVFVEHFERYAREQLANLQPNDLVVEIGSNDGTLLRFFKSAGMRVLGVDPAQKIAEAATASGIETWTTFFTESIAQMIGVSRGKAKLVVANNVFAHADDLAAIARSVRDLLDPDGRFVFEVSYLPDVLQKTLFDTIYHEHLSYHAIDPLAAFFKSLGMSLVHARRVDTHGGSVRVTVSPRAGEPLGLDAASLILEERSLGLGTGRGAVPLFRTFHETIAARGNELRAAIGAAAGEGHVAGYGAPAKATTLLHAFGLEASLDFVVDDSPHKQGRFLPGGRIPVLSSSAIDDMHPSVVVVLAWNFAGSILDKLAGYLARGGTCIVPLPVVTTHSHAGKLPPNLHAI